MVLPCYVVQADDELVIAATGAEHPFTVATVAVVSVTFRVDERPEL